MYSRDYRDIVGGGVLVLVGLWAGLHSLANFDIGSMGRMGPGMFPTGLGFLLALVGAIIVLPALFRSGPAFQVDWRPMIFIMGGVLAFAVALPFFGLIPSVVVLTIASACADNKLSWFATAVLAVALSFLGWLIFIFALGIVLEPFKWPF